MRTARFVYFTFILLLTAVVFLPSGSTQDYTRWHLPEGAIARFGKGSISDFVYFPDGHRLAVLSSIGIWIYDVHTGEELDLLTDLDTEDMWNIMELSPDGRTLAAATDGQVLLWDLQTNELKNFLVGHEDRVYSLAFSPTGEILAGGSRDNTIRLWDVQTGALVQAFIGHTDRIRLVAYSNDGKTLASVADRDDNTIRFWDVRTGKLLQTIADHADRIYDVVYSPDSRMLVSVGRDPAIRFWDVRTGRLLKTFTGIQLLLIQ